MGPLVLAQLKALLTCSVCGYSTPHVDSTSANMSYNDEMSFTSFHYLLNSSSFTFGHPDGELEGPVALVDDGLLACGLVLDVTA